MRNLIIAVTLTSFVSVAHAGVSNISENGSSASGKTAYKIKCTSGRDWRIWRANGQWWDGSGAQGGQSRDLNAQAKFLCR